MASTHTTDAGFDQLKDLNEQFLSAARETGNLYLDSYEKAMERTIELERTFAGLTKQHWLKDLVETQTDLAREVASSYTATARTLLK